MWFLSSPLCAHGMLLAFGWLAALQAMELGFGSWAWSWPLGLGAGLGAGLWALELDWELASGGGRDPVLFCWIILGLEAKLPWW